MSVVSHKSPHAAVLQRPLVECVAGAILEAFTDPARRAEWNRTYHEAFRGPGRAGGISDMHFVARCTGWLRQRGHCIVDSMDPWDEQVRPKSPDLCYNKNA